MFNRVIVPLDGSPTAAQALPAAERLAQLAGAPLHLVSVIDLFPMSAMSGTWAWGGYADLSLNDEIVESERVAAEAYLKQAQVDVMSRGHEVTVELLSGAPVQEILASTRLDDVIVMATHGRGGLSRWFLGSVAEAVIRRATVPVMLIRAVDHPLGEIQSPSLTGPTRV